MGKISLLRKRSLYKQLNNDDHHCRILWRTPALRSQMRKIKWIRRMIEKVVDNSIGRR